MILEVELTRNIDKENDGLMVTSECIEKKCKLFSAEDDATARALEAWA